MVHFPDEYPEKVASLCKGATRRIGDRSWKTFVPERMLEVWRRFLRG
jgi:hypothetical protein